MTKNYLSDTSIVVCTDPNSLTTVKNDKKLWFLNRTIRKLRFLRVVPTFLDIFRLFLSNNWWSSYLLHKFLIMSIRQFEFSVADRVFRTVNT